MSPPIPTKNPASSSSSSSRRQKPRRRPETLTPHPASADDRRPSDPAGIPRAPPPPLSPGPLDGLERRPIVLPDGSLRYYYALPPDYPVDPAAPQEEDYWSYLGLDDKRGPPPKRKHGDGDEYAWLRESVRRYGNPNAEIEETRASKGFDWHRENVRRYGNPNADADDVEYRERKAKKAKGEDGFDSLGEARALEEAFLKCSKLINESLSERLMYLEDGKHGPLRCIVCGRTSKAFAGVHELIMHAYTSEIPELRIDHLGLHKALCVLMGWNYAKAPETSKAYQSLSTDEAAANREDLIVWPPTVIIHNTNTGRRKDGRMNGMSDREVDMKLKELGFTGCTSKSLYGKGGHLGIAAGKFASVPAGLKEAERLAEHFKKDKRGREDWVLVEASQTGIDEKNPAIIKVDKETDEKKNMFYGYLATASDLEKVDIDTRKRAAIKSRREFDPSD